VRVRQLEAFVMVAEELHFGRAAELLHLSQPALSRQIDQLERELDVQLLRRDRRGVELTEAGAAYLEGLRAAIAQLKVAARTAQRVHLGEVGQLRVGHVDSSSYDVLPPALRRFRRALPAVGVSLVEGSSEAVVDGLVHQRVDVGLIRSAVEAEGLEDAVLLEEPYVAALPADHPAAAAEAVDPADLADDHFAVVLRQSAPLVHDEVLGICRAAGFTPSVAYTVAPLSSLLRIVGAGLATAIVPAGLVRHASLPGVVHRPLRDVTTALELRVAWRQGDPSAPVTTFVASLRAVADEGGEVD
jgi:DNA-binding transcriptional LysR family regulator